MYKAVGYYHVLVSKKKNKFRTKFLSWTRGGSKGGGGGGVVNVNNNEVKSRRNQSRVRVRRR